MCKRNEKCALCSTFRGKSLDECEKEGKCEANVQEVQVVEDIKEKTGKKCYHCGFPTWCLLQTKRFSNVL